MAASRLAMTGLFAAGGALSGALGAQHGSTAGQSPFGASVPVHIAHVGRIDIDLASAGGRLARVRCFGAAGDTSCFVARPSR